MPENSFSSISDTQIQKDKMQLSVIDVHPSLQEESVQENRREISARLCRIFQKYGGGPAGGGH